ncbi:MAG: nucleotidyltransferase domain-containing protein [Chloroflexi bacterium]|nr:nucleotidyltransferase domain-containing protein [Chloroflexota bacterium]
MLAEVVRRISEAVAPEKIYLYGSHAYGTPHENSDVDLLVLVKDSDASYYKRTLPIYKALRGLLIPIEIKVVTQEEFQRRLKWVVSVEKAASLKGKVVYERKR